MQWGVGRGIPPDAPASLDALQLVVHLREQLAQPLDDIWLCIPHAAAGRLQHALEHVGVRLGAVTGVVGVRVWADVVWVRISGLVGGLLVVRRRTQGQGAKVRVPGLGFGGNWSWFGWLVY